MKKIFIYSLIGMFSLSCSVSAPDTSSPSPQTPLLGGAGVGSHRPSLKDFNFADLEKEYKSFSTKALSDAYVSRMFTRFLTTSPNPTQLIRQLEFARYLKDVKSDSSYFDSLKTFISGNIAKFNLINNTSGVTQKKTSEPTTFGAFVDSLNPNPNNIVTSGLVLNLDAGNISSYPGTGTIWTDLSGNGKIGILTNGPVFTSANSGSIMFDGINDYVSFLNSQILPNGTGDFTVSAFFKTADSSTHNSSFRAVISTGAWNDTTSPHTWKISVNDGNPSGYQGKIDTWWNASIKMYTPENTYANNTWYNVVVSRNNNVFKLFINNVPKFTLNEIISLDWTNFYIGCGGMIGGLTNGGLWHGSISNVQVYNRTLSLDEITQNYNALKGRYGL